MLIFASTPIKMRIRDQAMTIRQLRILNAVEENGGIKAACHTMKIAQPVISHELKIMAREVGVPLHTRANRGIELTPAGHFLAREAKAIVADFDRLKPIIRQQAQHQQVESLTVGGNFAVSAALLPEILARFGKIHPNLKPQLRTGDRFLLEELLIKNQVEVAVMNHAPRNRQLVGERCGTDAIVPFVAPHHPLTKRRTIEVEDLEHVAFVTRNPPQHKGAAIRHLEVLRRKGLRPNVLMYCESPDGVKTAVLKNNAIGMLFESGVQHEIQQGRFKALKLPGNASFTAYRYIVRHRTRPLSPVARSFLQFLRATLAGRKTNRPRRKAENRTSK